MKKIKTRTFGSGAYIHGKPTSELTTYIKMIDRCYNKKKDNYARYGGSGVKVCARWRDRTHGFQNFLFDMGRKPNSKMQIDRINNDGDYKPSNCRWVTNKQNQNNRSDNRVIVYNKIEKTMAQWSEHFGVNKTTFKGNIYRRGEFKTFEKFDSAFTSLKARRLQK